jgi:hypothetical protein
VVQLLESTAPEFVAPLNVRRQVLYWFQHDAVPPVPYRADRFPIFIWNWGPCEGDVLYGFPQLGEADVIKVAAGRHTLSTSPASCAMSLPPLRQGGYGSLYRCAGRQIHCRSIAR